MWGWSRNADLFHIFPQLTPHRTHEHLICLLETDCRVDRLEAWPFDMVLYSWKRMHNMFHSLAPP
jgi:hypothetical protein